MDDKETRAELGRISPEYAEEWDECQLALKRWPNDPVSHLVMAIKALRLLAEQHKALREIGEKTTEIITHPPSPDHTIPIMLANVLVAIDGIVGKALDAGKEK